MNLNKLSFTSQVIIVALVVFTLFVGLSCVSAADVDASGCHINDTSAHIKNLHMSVKYNVGTGYHWEITPKTHGVTLMSKTIVQDKHGVSGSTATVHYTFLKHSKDYYVQLALISPTGKIVKVVDSDMLN